MISFSESKLFQDIRDYILEVDERAIYDEGYAKFVLQYLVEHQYERYVYYDNNYRDYRFELFINEIRRFQERTVIGLLEDGTILFMIKNEQDNLYQGQNNLYNDGCEIYWSNEVDAWELRDGRQSYSFELPKEIYQEWVESADEQRRAAVRIKQNYFSKIVLFENNFGERDSIRTIYLSERFIETAKRNLNMV